MPACCKKVASPTELDVFLKRRARFRDCFGLGRVHQDREVMGQQRWLDRHLRQSHIQNIGGRCPDTLGTLSASFKGAAPTAWARRSTPPCKPNATAHEPSRKTLAAFACERSTGAATLLRLRQTLGLGLGIFGRPPQHLAQLGLGLCRRRFPCAYEQCCIGK